MTIRKDRVRKTVNAYGVEMNYDLAVLEVVGLKVSCERQYGIAGRWQWAMAFRRKHLWNMTWWGT